MPPMLAQPSLPAPSRWPLPSVVAPQLGHISPPEAAPVVRQPVAQPRRAGRRFGGCEQPLHQTDNLVADERHVTHQQADQPGQGESRARGRVQEQSSDAY